MKRCSENVGRQQPAFTSASSEKMFARRNDNRRLDEQTAKAFERSNLNSEAAFRFACRIKPRVSEESLSHLSPRGASYCAERSECQPFGQCVGCLNRTRSQMSESCTPRRNLAQFQKGVSVHALWRKLLHCLNPLRWMSAGGRGELMHCVAHCGNKTARR